MKRHIVVLVLVILLSSCNMVLLSGQNAATAWENVTSPDPNIEELAALNGIILARSDYKLYKSTDSGTTWQQVNFNLDIQYLPDMDVDNGNLYIATGDGVIVSSDEGETFEWSYDSTPDTAVGVDFEQGYGWAIVNMWGTPSGPHKKSPGGTWQYARGDLPWPYMGVLRIIVTDRNDPGNIAFTYGHRGDTGTRYFRTVNGGQNWLECESKVIYTTLLNGTSYALGESKYSTDNGKTWQDLPFTVETFIKDPDSDNLFAAKYGRGVYTGSPDSLRLIGLEEEAMIQSFAISNNYLFALSVNGEIFKIFIPGTSCGSVCAANLSTPTLCAEEDNVNIPIFGDLQSFVIEATHPAYNVGTDNCEADFTNCPGAEPGYPFTPHIISLYNDGETIVEAVTESEWWLPSGMDVNVDNDEGVTDVHYIRLYRKIQGTDDQYPQFFVLYMDGNLRLIPHPPAGASSVCFGSSVIVGPAAAAERPFAEISSLRYNSSLQTLDVYYKSGGSAVISIAKINRTIARIRVTVNYSTNGIPFATFRSMFVENGNSDADSVRWTDTQEIVHDEPILTFPGGESTGWFFYRSHRSQHNTSAPDTWIGTESQTGDPPRIELNRSRLDFGGIPTGAVPPSQDFMITNTGGGTLDWSVTNNQTWLNCSPSSGTGSGSVSVSTDPTGLAEGTYNGTITISDPNASNSPQTLEVTLTVYSNGQTGGPFGQFSTPIDGTTVSSSIPVSGWALDDIGVTSVKIYRGDAGNLVYIGDAVSVEGARPDVEQAYPTYPMNYKAGWGYMLLTNFLPDGGNGTFTLHAAAADVEGNVVSLGTKTIFCDNINAVNPFGAIDTPIQGGIASGNGFANWGWALTPQPNGIPTDGSTINVFVDGIALGHPVYNIHRPDIAELFPGYQNSDGAVGYFDLDTTVYENGVHTIYWTVTDDAGNSDGIGSRYFTVTNSQGARISENRGQGMEYRNLLPEITVDRSSPVKIVKGYDRDTIPLLVFPDGSGIVAVHIKELERLEIHLENYSIGYSVVGNQLKRLPIGSTMDREKGVFYWQPGPGFIGDYQFVFFKKSKNGEMSKKIVIVVCSPGTRNRR